MSDVLLKWNNSELKVFVDGEELTLSKDAHYEIKQRKGERARLVITKAYWIDKLETDFDELFGKAGDAL